MTTSALGHRVRTWWMIAVRGQLAMLFGVAVLVRPDAFLSTVVVLFGVYAVSDVAHQR